MPEETAATRTETWRNGVGLALTATALVYLYGYVSRAWTPLGGTHGRFLWLEVPLFVLLAWLCHVRLPGKGTKLRSLGGWLLACVPPLLLYGLLDGGDRYLHRCLRISDLRELPALADASPALAATIGAILGGAVAVPFLRLWSLRRRASPSAVVRWLVLRAAAIVLLILALAPAWSPLRSYVVHAVEQRHWSERKTMTKNGRFATVLHFYVRRLIAMNRVRQANPTAANDERFGCEIAVPRNVHILVLESLIDPRLLRAVEFEPSPLHPRMRELLGGNGEFDLVTAPVYGGGTAQTEFELLSGTPALGLVETIEFNALEGHPVPSFVRALRARGYATVATIAASRLYYNGPRAYRSLGFEHVFFLDGDGYLGEVGSEKMFDGELLGRNLEFIESRFVESGRPFLNYVVGLYGHHPYERDTELRPVVCRRVPDGDGSSTLERVANQFYYRTGALAEYLDSLAKRDPNAIVYMTSDHLPPLLGSGLDYRHSPKRNICIAFDAGRRVEGLDWNTTYCVPYLLFGKLCRESVPVPGPAELEQSYFAMLAAGLGISH